MLATPPGEVSWRFVDATVDATFAPQEPLASRSNYLLGDDPALWRRNVRHFARLRAAGIYPGVDLVLRGDDGQLAFDLELAPGADLAPIRLAWSGQQALRVLPSGAVEVVLAGGTLELSAPVVWEVIGDSRRLLQARFRQVAADTLAFSVDGRDPAARLVIDPTISWATYLGGSGDENALAMATAADGGILIAGLTTSSNFPTASALRPTSGGGTDGFIAKLSADGQDLVFATYLGGSGSDLIKALAVDGSGNIVVAGQTTSSNFPTKSAFQSTRRGSLDAFVTKLTQNGDALVFSTYFGSANCGVCGGLTQANAVTVDGNANVYFTGASFGTSFPGTAGTLKPAFARSCNETNPDFCPGALAGFNVDAFVAKLSPTGSRVYATLLGGNNYTDIANAIDVDSAGNTYVGGYTGAGDFPTTAGAFIGNASSFAAPFVCKLSATASQLVYSTFLDDGRQPALAESIVTDLRVNSAGQVTAVGFTGSSDFPTTAGAIGRPPATPTGRSGFVTRLNATGTGQLASTLLGGQSSSNYVQSLELLPNGSTLVGGRDTTRSVPAIGLPAPTSNGSGYVAELNPGFTALTLAGMIGKTESVDGVAAVGEDVYVAGLTKTAGLATSGALDTSLGGPSDAFVAKISPGPPPTCLPDATHLCLAGDRFRVAVHWSVASQGTSGEGKAVELTGDTGYFWFFSAANVELVLKVLDGRPLNGSWWVFYGALSNVAYTITVTDTTSGAAKTYTNAQGNLASVADTSALPGGATLAAFSLSTGLSATASELAALTALSQAADAEVDAPAPDTAPNRLHRPEAAAAVPIELGQAERRSATAGRVLPLAFTSPFVPATTGNGSPVGSTYEIEAMLAEDTNGDGSGELFHTCPGAGDFVVTFNGTAETLPAYTCAANTTPRVSETFTDHSDGTATVELRLVSTNGADLFPGGLVAGSTPVNGAGLRIGFFAGSDPLDWTPAHKVLAATIDLRANGGSVFAGGASALNVANFFGSPAPWDGNFGIYYAGRAGDGIDEVILKLTVEHDAPPPPPPACVVDDTHLCLAGDRFRVSVAWQTPQGGSGVGHGVELTADTGYFWFFSASNVELVTKILDGRPVNGFWWTFYGALSNVRYTLTVQDTSNGHVKTYTNPQGSLASVADTQSLP